MSHNFKKIAVLMGGWSNERDVSLSSGGDIIKALALANYDVWGIDVKKDLEHLVSELKSFKPDVVFNALHGTGGEDGVIQGVLTMLGIPYTHSGVLASSIAMHKIISRQLFEQQGIPFAPYHVMSINEYLQSQTHPFPFPYVIKPICEGSSRGVYIISCDEDKSSALKTWTFGNRILIETYIPGREIQVAVLSGKAIGAIEVVPHNGFYDYEAKYTEGKTTHIMPPNLLKEDQERLYHYAEKAHTSLECKGITRSDFRLNETEDHLKRIYMLEINTQPGMTPLSLVPEIAAYYGMTYLDVIEHMLACAGI